MLTLFRIQVERALTFWRDGLITWDGIVQEGKGKSSTIRKPIDVNTGKETKATEFNQAKWGVATNGYLNSIKTNIEGGKLDWTGFIKAASKFKKPSRHGESTIASSSTPAGMMDVRALIADDSEPESDGSNDHGAPGDDE
jgi:hypothetical protein